MLNLQLLQPFKKDCSSLSKHLMTNCDDTVKATHVPSRHACHKGCHCTIVCSHSSTHQVSE